MDFLKLTLLPPCSSNLRKWATQNDKSKLGRPSSSPFAKPKNKRAQTKQAGSNLTYKIMKYHEIWWLLHEGACLSGDCILQFRWIFLYLLALDFCWKLEEIRLTSWEIFKQPPSPKQEWQTSPHVFFRPSFENQQKINYQVIQSDLFIPYLEVTIRLWKGHVNSPSQKGHQQNCQVENSLHSFHGNLRGPPLCHVYPQEIAGLIKGLLTIGFP